MITRSGKKVVFVKDIPSNLIEEAIFILKTEDSENRVEQSMLNKRKYGDDMVVREAEDIVKEYVYKFQKEYDTEKRKVEREKYAKIQKIKNIICFVAVFVIIGVLFFVGNH